MRRQALWIACFVALMAIKGSCDTTADSDLDFLVMGDWGGLPIWPYYTPGENSVAKSMGKLAGQSNASFALTLGDNFYFGGVKDVEDKRFKETFEDVFVSEHLQHPGYFRVLAGNHDHYGNCSAEIAYSKVSQRWHYPDYYYSMTEKAGNSTVQVMMIDTVILSGATKEPADAQWKWINSTLQHSDADFLLVAGHFPVWSICEHGPTSLLVERLKPMLEAAKVTAYLAGHDHCAQHIDEGRGVQYHGIGAGIMCNPSTKHKDAIPSSSLKWHYDAGLFGVLDGAFGRVSVGAKGLVVMHYGSKGELLYQAEPIAKRT